VGGERTELGIRGIEDKEREREIKIKPVESTTT